MRSLVLAAAMLAAASGVASAEVRVRLMKGSAIGMASTFDRAGDAPRSTFQKAVTDGALSSVFVASEVAPARIQTTRTLLTELNARRSHGTIVVDLPADVMFDFDKAVIRHDAEPALDKAAEVLRVIRPLRSPSAAIPTPKAMMPITTLCRCAGPRRSLIDWRGPQAAP